MPYRVKGSPNWWVKITSGGRTSRRSTGTTDREEAEKIEAEWRRPIQGHLWDEVIQRYLEAKWSERAGYAVKGLKPYFSGRVIENIKPEDIAYYKSNRGVSVGTMRKELGVFRAAVRYCQKELGWAIPDPVSGRIPDPPARRVRWLTKTEYLHLVEAARSEPKAPHLAPFLILAVNTGMRKNEMLQLVWSRVDLDARLVYLEPSDQKSRRYDSVPLNDNAVEALKKLRELPKPEYRDHKKARERAGRVFPVDAVKRSFRTACDRAGIEDFRVHDLRHTCAAWLVQAGVPIRDVADVLRHEDISTTMIYAHLSPAHARSAVLTLDTI